MVCRVKIFHRFYYQGEVFQLIFLLPLLKHVGGSNITLSILKEKEKEVKGQSHHFKEHLILFPKIINFFAQQFQKWRIKYTDIIKTTLRLQVFKKAHRTGANKKSWSQTAIQCFTEYITTQRPFTKKIRKLVNTFRRIYQSLFSGISYAETTLCRTNTSIGWN